ncbi:MAG: ATP-binding protein [Chlorobiales bacterium]|nr:ATP-binding protein [Chlorobiales bacterium]
MRNFSYRHAEKELVLFDINKGVRDTLVIARNEYRYVADVEEHFQEVPLLYCNPEQINQVFLNLIVNSAHAIASMQQDEKGRIVIRTWYDPDHVYFSIEDNGPGISPEVVRRVFEPFFTTKKPGHGTGLGLSISYDIVVHKHNGQLDVYSPSTGGTVFTVSLPRNRSINGESN